MAATPRGLLDTSVFIALESARPLDADALPEESVVCPITIADRCRRGRRLGAPARPAAPAAPTHDVNDLWVAASAVASTLPVVTQDDAFDPLAGVLGLTVIRV